MPPPRHIVGQVVCLAMDESYSDRARIDDGIEENPDLHGENVNPGGDKHA